MILLCVTLHAPDASVSLFIAMKPKANEPYTLSICLFVSSIKLLPTEMLHIFLSCINLHKSRYVN